MLPYRCKSDIRSQIFAYFRSWQTFDLNKKKKATSPMCKNCTLCLLQKKVLRIKHALPLGLRTHKHVCVPWLNTQTFVCMDQDCAHKRAPPLGLCTQTFTSSRAVHTNVHLHQGCARTSIRAIHTQTFTCTRAESTKQKVPDLPIPALQ